MIFDRSRFRNNIEDVTLRNDTLACVNEYKYLGHEIERNLADTKDVECRLQQFSLSSMLCTGNFIRSQLKHLYIFLILIVCQNMDWHSGILAMY